MNNFDAAVSRRTALRGLGTLVALPWLESLARAAGSAATAGAEVAGGALTAAGTPRRAAFIYVPNGVHVPDWMPKTVGALGELPETLKSLEPVKKSLNVLSNLTLDKARANGDGAGDHARAMSAFLTGRQPRKTHGADIRIGVSADQYIARAVGETTRYESLELGIERGGQAGNCDSGYSCAYSSNLSWRSESTPNAKEIDPKLVFERLFAGTDTKELAGARAKRDARNKSVLDFVNEDAKQLTKALGQTDQRKLDEYLTAVREVELRVQKIAKSNADRKPVARPNVAVPAGVPKQLQEHIRLMCDMAVLAFQTDLTRVITLPFANDGSNTAYPMIGVGDGHHDLSHHGRDEKKQAKLKKINAFHVEQLAYFVTKLASVKEANGKSILDNSCVVYGSGISDGDKHNHDELPILTVGGFGGTLEGGRHLKYERETPLMNLYLALFQRVGAPAAAFGDSTGVLKI